MNERKVSRRLFMGTAGATSAFTAAQAVAATSQVALVIDMSEPVASLPPVLRAAKELETAFTAKGMKVARLEKLQSAASGVLCILAAHDDAPIAKQLLRSAKASIPAVPEALGIIPGKIGGTTCVLATGHDVPGLVYALSELTDRVETATEVSASLAFNKPITEQPANVVRSMMRMFTSDVEDKKWFNDREMWPRYLSHLAAQRFNNFHLAFGIGYDFIRQVTDAYFLFTYPFLVSVPGYDVRVPQLPDAERESNLEMLRYISDQTVAAGMRFQLGLWMHGYEWIDSPRANYTIEGLNGKNHGPYCRDALRLLLQSCPAISSVCLRVHGESGVNEGSYDFWKTVFEAFSTCGRTITVDMHPKGIDQEMLDIAAGTKQPYRVSPKFWAEHMGMPYHQADIRALETPKQQRGSSALMKLSGGSRSFLRYGYGDLMKEDRQWGIVHRIWPGTQRLLLWGDPVTAAHYARAFAFCGSQGVDIMEPLSFKGRRGSGHPGDRAGYADASLKPRWDWEKYLYSTRVWGRLLYNPDCEPGVWLRYLRSQFGEAAPHAQAALASASRILPIVTTAHGASAANNSYWPEMYFNQSLVEVPQPTPYTDSPAPKVFGNVSPFDPQLFSRMNDFADNLLDGKRDGRYSPIEVAQWVEDLAAAARHQLAEMKKKAGKDSPELRRLTIDVSVQAWLGSFFGAKFRCGVLYRLFEKTGSAVALERAIAQYQTARAAWQQVVSITNGVYVADITVGELPWLRGHWSDRLAAIDRDIALLRGRLNSAQAKTEHQYLSVAIEEALGRPKRWLPDCTHKLPSEFEKGKALEIVLLTKDVPVSVVLYYRRVNQAERFMTTEMTRRSSAFQAAIPTAYLTSPYPVEYYFELRKSEAIATLYPGFEKGNAAQPYFVVHGTRGTKGKGYLREAKLGDSASAAEKPRTVYGRSAIPGNA